MPMPRYHGGAPIQHYQLNAPAFRGVNRQARNAVLGPEWATRLENTVLDSQSRVASRKGWATLTSVAAAKAFRRTFETIGTFLALIFATHRLNAEIRDTRDAVEKVQVRLVALTTLLSRLNE